MWVPGERTVSLSALEALILDLLSARNRAYGLELVSASQGRLKRGSIYVTLGRMEQKGLVTSVLDERPGEGPPRRLYEATAYGLRALVATRLLHGDLPFGAKV
ncbi:MAG: PadR family transcriptional regulator [Acidobacteria bacterium]|nr:MAG: PadR family transcriptional regulator [Acidobacteriota bacterium]